MVFVLDRQHRPLMPCSEKRARLLLQRKRAVVHRLLPFTIRLKDGSIADSLLQPVILKLDPGSKATGIAVVREQAIIDGSIHHALHLAQLEHRGELVHQAMQQLASFRRRRRSSNLRYRPRRFKNRRRRANWIAPSLESRVGNILTWVRRYGQFAPLRGIALELVKFDTQVLQHQQINGLEYQQGTLAGYEVRQYLLEKWSRKCAYCEQAGGSLEIDHIVPKSRGGSDRASNLCLACHKCNQSKGNRTAAEFGHSAVQAQAKQPLKDAAAVNVTRFVLHRFLQTLGLPVGCWSGGRTKWNRIRFGLFKTHAIDALCVGDITGARPGDWRILRIQATGRGQYQRTNVNASGFPHSYCMRWKRVHGMQTGDLVCARVPARLKTRGKHVGRVAVRARGDFRIGRVDGINWRFCQLIQRADGYTYELGTKEAAVPSLASSSGPYVAKIRR